MPEATEPTSLNRHANHFDLIRLTAALFVLITHSYHLSASRKREADFMQTLTGNHYELSYFGVAIFFIISGYLIAQSLYRSPSYLNYLKKRALRIFPGLLVVTTLTVLVLGPLATTLPLRTYFTTGDTYRYFYNVLLYATHPSLPGVFTHNPAGDVVNGSIWTLVYEFTFYLLLLGAHSVGLLRWRVLNVALLGLGIMAYDDLQHTPLYDYYFPTVNLTVGFFLKFLLYFWAGVVYFLYRDGIHYTGRNALLALLLLAFMAAFRPYWFNMSVYLLLPYLIFYLAFLKSPLVHLSRYGDFSYGIYIYSYPVQQYLSYSFPSLRGFEMIWLTALFVIPLAYLSWHFIEAPALRWARRTDKPKVALSSTSSEIMRNS